MTAPRTYTTIEYIIIRHNKHGVHEDKCFKTASEAEVYITGQRELRPDHELELLQRVTKETVLL